MRVMGLDVGSKTVGVAISDPLGFTAQGVEIIKIDEEAEEFGFDRLGELVKEYKVEKFVVGLPKNMNNTEGPRVEAERMLVEQADISRGKRKKVIDKLAAQLILQNYLDRMF